MDTESLPPLAIFIGFLALFSYLSIAEYSGGNGGGVLRDTPSPQRSILFFSPFKYACVIAISLSGLYLAQGVLGLNWGLISTLSLALLVGLTIIQRLAHLLAQRKPAFAARCSQPILALTRQSDRRARNVNNGASSGSDGAEDDGDLTSENLDITEQELVSMDRRDRAMLRSIINLDTSTAHEVMVPRLDMVALDINTPLIRATAPIISSGHTRIPVYEETIDHIVGIIHSLDLLDLLSQDDPAKSSLRDLLRPAYFIPETKRLDDLLEEFQQRAIQMAVVVDEYGGTEGLITMEDLLEEIVGEIEDEFSIGDEREVIRQPDGSAMVYAGVATDVIEELFDTQLDNPDVDTVGGYVYVSLGRMPRIGDVVETDQLHIEIASVMGRRIQRLRIHPKNANAQGTNPG